MKNQLTPSAARAADFLRESRIGLRFALTANESCGSRQLRGIEGALETRRSWEFLPSSREQFNALEDFTSKAGLRGTIVSQLLEAGILVPSSDDGFTIRLEVA